MSEIQQRTAEQLFRTLGELKGGAMKFGQAMSVLEAALPDELAAPYRDQLTRLQDSAPPMPTQTVRDQIAARPRRRLARRAGLARRRPDRRRRRSARCTGVAGTTAARSRSRCSTPAPARRCSSDLRQLARLARTIGAAGARHRDQAAGRGAAGPRRRRARLPASRPRRSAPSPTAFRDDPDIVVPDVVAVGDTVLVTEWLESPASLAVDHRERHPGGARPLRRAVRAVPLRRPGAHRACCTPTRTPATSGSSRTPTAAPAGSACSTTAPSPGCPSAGLPEAMGRADPDRRRSSDHDAAGRGAARGGLHQGPASGSTPSCCSTTSRPFVEPTQVERFRFSREWMRSQFQRINNPQEPSYTVAMKLNLPPAYLLIHRTWLGGVGVLSQLEAEAPFRAILDRVPARASPSPS